MKILVTGGAGFIGSHVVDKYIELGHKVIVIDNLSSGSEHNIHPSAKFYNMDICSEQLIDVFKNERPEVVNHHAAQKSVPKSVENPKFDAHINIIGLLNVLQASLDSGVKKFIYVSSGGALAGDADIIPTNESVPPKLLSPYAVSKYAGELYLRVFSKLYNIKTLTLRYANVYGPRQVPEGECGVIPIFLENFLSNRPSTLMAYPDQPKGTTRDYVYVDDIVKANVLALTRGENEVLNLGSGNEIHIEEVYETMKRVYKHNLPLLRRSERKGDVRRSCLDISKAKEVLGWEPTISLEEGLQKLLKYHQS